jgi:hypothetical protein
MSFQRLCGRSVFVDYAILALILFSGVTSTFSVGIGGGGWEPPPPPPPGGLQAIINGPSQISTEVHWTIGSDVNLNSFPYTNGQTIVASSGGYFLGFRPMAGWKLPEPQWVWINADSTNTVFGSCMFTSLVGDYEGLFSEASGPEFASAGLCRISGGKRMAFSGRISLEGIKYSFSGKFDTNGNAWATIARKGKSSLSVHLVAGYDAITGEISSGSWTAGVLVHRNTFNSKTAAFADTGKYTLALMGSNNSVAQSNGDGFGTVTISRSGIVKLAATLGDGTKVSQGTHVSKGGIWPFYVPLYSGRGFAMGWVQLTRAGGSDDFGSITWMKLPDVRAKSYPEGFTNQMQALVSEYQHDAAKALFENGPAWMTLQHENSSQEVAVVLTVDSKGKISGQNGLSLSIASSGSLNGRMLNPVSGKKISFKGVVLQDQSCCRGLFVEEGHTGSFYLVQ